MKKIILSLFVAVAALALWSCGDSNTPSAVAEKSVKCLQNSDYEGYVDLLGTGDGKDSEEGEEQLVALLREKGKTLCRGAEKFTKLLAEDDELRRKLIKKAHINTLGTTKKLLESIETNLYPVDGVEDDEYEDSDDE